MPLLDPSHNSQIAPAVKYQTNRMREACFFMTYHSRWHSCIWARCTWIWISSPLAKHDPRVQLVGECPLRSLGRLHNACSTYSSLLRCPFYGMGNQSSLLIWCRCSRSSWINVCCTSSKRKLFLWTVWQIKGLPKETPSALSSMLAQLLPSLHLHEIDCNFHTTYLEVTGLCSR